MKYYLLILIVAVSFFQEAYCWGEKGHKLINRKAIEALPEEMNGFKQWISFIIDHASDPDKRRDTDSTEFPKHFIDIDFYKEFQKDSMIQDRQKLAAVYNDSIVLAMGILPWATYNTFINLTNAFKEHNRDKALFYATDLGHYVGDGHQPLHTVLNYDGQLTGQKGIHARYEEIMIDSFAFNSGTLNDPFSAELVDNPQDFIFKYITNVNTLVPVILGGDLFAFSSSGNRQNNDYYSLLWFRTRYMTKIIFNEAAKDFASLVYTAWVNAGKPSFQNFN